MEDHSETIVLDTLISKRSSVQVYLMSGLKLDGKIVGADEFTIVLESQRFGKQMFYKHAVSTIVLGEER